jgi:hypothetical protein
MITLLQLRQGPQETCFGRYIHANLRPLQARQISERIWFFAGEKMLIKKPVGKFQRAFGR